MGNDKARAAVAQRDQQATVAGNFRDLVEKQKGEIGRALAGTALNPERFARVALTVFRQSPGLQRCDPNSVLGALMTSAQLGLEPGPLGEAYLVPFKGECVFIVGYQGLIKLAWQSGQIAHIDAATVHTNDEFTYRKGSHPVLEHVPAIGDRGDVYCYYAVASFHNGGHVSVVMSREDVDSIRKQSPSANAKTSPWTTHFDAMARKTCIRQLAKYLPKSTSMATAVQHDGQSVTTLDPMGAGWGDDVLEGETVDDSAEEQDAASGAVDQLDQGEDMSEPEPGVDYDPETGEVLQ